MPKSYCLWLNCHGCWLFIVLWRVGEHQFSSAKCPHVLDSTKMTWNAQIILPLTQLLWLLAFYCTLARGRASIQFSKMPQVVPLWWTFPIITIFPSNNCSKKPEKKAIVVKRFSVSRQLARATTVSILICMPLLKSIVPNERPVLE